MKKFLKKWFDKKFFRKSVKIIFTLLFIMILLSVIGYWSDVVYIMSEYFFWFVFGVIGLIGCIGIYNIIKDRKRKGLKLNDEEVKEWNEFYKDQPKKQINR